MPRLTQFLLRHRLAVVAAWLVVLVAGGAAVGAVPSRLSREFSFPGQEGYEANVAILETYGNGGPGNPLVPALVALLGRWNWWLPPWAARLLRTAPSTPAPEPAGPGREPVYETFRAG